MMHRLSRRAIPADNAVLAIAGGIRHDEIVEAVSGD